jgi:hypothetical protein
MVHSAKRELESAPWAVTPPVEDIFTDVPGGVFEADAGIEEGTKGAAKVAPAPISATMTGMTTVKIEMPLARTCGESIIDT